MNIYSQVLESLKGQEGKSFSRSEIINVVHQNFGTNKSSIIPSDYCYNRINVGINFGKHLFLRIGGGDYKFLGENFPFSGWIYKKSRGETKDSIVGEWKNGEYELWKGETILDNESSDSEEPSSPMEGIGTEELQRLYEEYMELLELEVNVFGVKPTEVRHLIGRIGEFKCALLTEGKIAHMVNQHGFDVISSTGQRISVKTTAQKAGFVAINQKTLNYVDELMILQYANNEFRVLYYGEVSKAVEQARLASTDKFELDLSKAKKLQSKKSHNHH